MNMFITSEVSHIFLYPSHLLPICVPRQKLIWFLHLLEMWINGTPQCVLFFNLTFSTPYYYFEIYPCFFVCIINWFLFIVSSIPLYRRIIVYLSIYLLEVWIVFIIWLLQIKKLRTSMYKWNDWILWKAYLKNFFWWKYI